MISNQADTRQITLNLSCGKSHGRNILSRGSIGHIPAALIRFAPSFDGMTALKVSKNDLRHSKENILERLQINAYITLLMEWFFQTFFVFRAIPAKYVKTITWANGHSIQLLLSFVLASIATVFMHQPCIVAITQPPTKDLKALTKKIFEA